MEEIDGLELTNSSEIVDYVIKNIIYKDEYIEKFQSLIEETRYRDDGIFEMEIKINGIDFEREDLNQIFTNIYDNMEKYFENKYKNIEDEIEQRVQVEFDNLIEKINLIRYDN